MELVYERKYSIVEIGTIAKELIPFLDRFRIFCFRGEMGAGKTTLIEEMCRQLGCKDMMSSPTYAIMNEYNLSGDTIMHADLFRVKEVEEIVDIGFPDSLDRSKYAFIEWYEKAVLWLPKTYGILSLQVLDEDHRLLKLECIYE